MSATNGTGNKMVAPKTTSDTTTVGDYTYIFLNRPDSDDISWIRFTDPDKPEQGKIRGLVSSEGAIAAQSFGDKSIKLYYTAAAEDTAGKSCLKEIRLLNADQGKTNVAHDWQSASDDPSINFEDEISEGSRLVDGTSFLSVSTRKEGNALYPVITWKDAGTKPFFNYAYKQASGKWHMTKLALK